MNKEVFNALTALIGVGENGGVMGWMVEIHNTYGTPYEKLVQYPLIGNVWKGEMYMELDGFSYFDTKIKHTNESVFEFEFCVKKDYTDNSIHVQVFGGRTSANDSSIIIQKNQVRIDSWAQYSLILNRWRKVCISQKKCVIDNVTISTSNLSVNTHNWTIIYGNSSNNGSIIEAQSLDGGLKPLKHTKNDIVVNYIIPCATNKMIDLVTGEVLTNQGTGTASIVTIE